MKKDYTIKIIGVSLLGLIVLWLVSSVLFPAGYGASLRYNMPGLYNYGYNSFYGISSMLTFIIQVFFVVFIITSMIGAASLIKNNLLNSDDLMTFKDSPSNDSAQESTEALLVKTPSETVEATSEVQVSQIEDTQNGGETPEIENISEEKTSGNGESNPEKFSENAETEHSTLEQPETGTNETNQTVKGKNTCPECGHELDPEWKICLNCGKELKKSRKRKNKNTED